MTDAAHPVPHPAPHRRRTSLFTLLFGLAAGPAGWVTQVTIDYGLSSYACFPHDMPHRVAPPPGWGMEKGWLLAINFACVALIVLGFLAAWSGWRRTEGEKQGDAEDVLEVGEGRSRFLAQCGMLTAAGFLAATLFDTVVLAVAPTCWSLS